MLNTITEPVRRSCVAIAILASAIATSASAQARRARSRRRYRVREASRSSAWVGFTAKVRDATIALEQGAVASRKDDLGFVPLLHLAGEWRMSPRWLATIDGDALAGGPGRAEDVALKLGYRVAPRLSLHAGYRMVEGGADVPETYSFAWLHYGVVSVRWGLQDATSHAGRGGTRQSAGGRRHWGMATPPLPSRREYLRHTVGVPLEVERLGESAPLVEAGVNVSHGGLAFHSRWCPEVGEVLHLRIPTVDPPFEARARVTWCRPEGGIFLVGVQFLDASDAFRSRMVQQVCAIEHYRAEVREREGRELGTQEAAEEWIARFAGRFPSPASESDGGSPDSPSGA